MAESIKLKLLSQIPVRIAVSSVIKMAVDRDKAKGCEVIISGKLSQQRAKSMKFKKGYMISSGQAKDEYLETSIRHAFLKQGVMGIKVKIMKPYNAESSQCAKNPLPDFVEFYDTKKDEKEQERITTKAGDVQWFEYIRHYNYRFIHLINQFISIFYSRMILLFYPIIPTRFIDFSSLITTSISIRHLKSKFSPLNYSYLGFVL